MGTTRRKSQNTKAAAAGGDGVPNTKVSLCRQTGETSIYIDAEINAAGDLVVSGQDTGKAPIEAFGDSDYEYWLTIPALGKDLMLLALIERQYGANPRAVSELQQFLESKGIACNFQSYT
jgi:hypothetical protein